MLHANVSVAEALWVGISGLGLLVNAAMLAFVVGDLRALRRARRNGAKRLVAWTTVGVKGTLTSVQAIFVAIGLFAAVNPPTNPGRPITPVALVVSAGLILATTLLAGLGVFMHARRVLLLNYLADEAEMIATAGSLHAETMGELHHNTAITAAAQSAAAAAHVEASEARAMIERIDEATRPKEGC